MTCLNPPPKSSSICTGHGLAALGILAALGVLAVLGVLAMFGEVPISFNGSQASDRPLPEADTPPIEFAYLDPLRADAYLGQAEGGLASSEQRSEQLTDSINASVPIGTAGQVGGSEQKQLSTVATVTPQAADRFYTLLRRLREGGEADYKKGACNEEKSTHWLGDVNDEDSAQEVMDEVECIGVGNFIRIRHAQLFLPPFAQALPKVQSANAFFGALPAPRTAFTSPTQSVEITKALSGYAKLVGSDPRMPFVAAPYGADERVGHGVTFFLPAGYGGITSEPSLLSGSVTIVGEIVYSAGAGAPYIDYPTVDTFGRALLKAQKALRTDLGVCSKAPPAETLLPSLPKSRPSAALTHRSPSRTAPCTSEQQTLNDVKKSVTFKPPVVVVLPLAIYE
jgi:hypothetical protein